MHIFRVIKFSAALASAVILIMPGISVAGVNVDDNLLKGASVMFGGESDANLKICPQGARVIDDFLRAWRAGDYSKMYELVDDDSKAGYSFEQAKFDFQFMEYKPYKISSLRAVGDNYEFILKYGAYMDNDIKTIKLLINATTFKIIKAAKNSIFKLSADDYK